MKEKELIQKINNFLVKSNKKISHSDWYGRHVAGQEGDWKRNEKSGMLEKIPEISISSKGRKRVSKREINKFIKGGQGKQCPNCKGTWTREKAPGEYVCNKCKKPFTKK